MRIIVLITLPCLLLAAAGCRPAGEFGVAHVSGTVTCAGAPVPHAMVFFEPLADGANALVGKQGIARADENGKFVISTYGEEDGAVLGKHRVRVGAPNSDDHPGYKCPCELNPEKDVLEVEVTEDGENEFEIALTKKTGRVELSLDDLEALEDARHEARMKAKR